MFFAVMAVLLAARLAYIQIFCHDEFTAAAVSQYEITVEGLDTRGVILDRNSMPLTGGVKRILLYNLKKTQGRPSKEPD